MNVLYREMQHAPADHRVFANTKTRGVGWPSRPDYRARPERFSRDAELLANIYEAGTASSCSYAQVNS